MRFWDSSAIVPLCVEEKYTHVIKGLLTKDQTMIVWWGTVIECMSAFVRQVREGNLNNVEQEQVKKILHILASSWTEICACEEVRQEAKRLLASHNLRSADSLQLAAAILWVNYRPDAEPFVTLDDNLRLAAQKEGFLVLP